MQGQIAWLFANFSSPSHWVLCTLPVWVYWLLAGYYTLTIKPEGTLPRPAYQIIRAVVIQQLIQFLVTMFSVPEIFDYTFTAEVAVRLVVCALIFDTYEYWLHRYMHINQWLYKNVHSVHHQLLDNRPYAALYNHPFEAFLMDTVGSVVAASLSGTDVFWFSMFGCLATLKTVHDHVGTSPNRFDPFYLIFSNNAKYHAVHHVIKGRKTNFSQPFFTFWDTWMGTTASDHVMSKSSE